MTTGERWKVYPLLFLTLGIVVKDKLIKVVNTDKVFCNALVVTDPKGNEQALISSSPAGGILRIHGNGNNPTILLGHTEKLYGLIFADAKGNLVSPTIAVPAAQPHRDPHRASPAEDKPPFDEPPPGAPTEPDAAPPEK